MISFNNRSASGQVSDKRDLSGNDFSKGSVFVMIGLGMNSFINSQGFGGIGMMTVVLGAVSNIILDPVFIFLFHMGVKGAALPTAPSR